jgi:hypothetical protein
VLSETDFLRLRKNEEPFLASVGGGGGCSFKFCIEAAVCGTLGRGDLSCEEMWLDPLGVVRGRCCWE